MQGQARRETEAWRAICQQGLGKILEECTPLGPTRTHGDLAQGVYVLILYKDEVPGLDPPILMTPNEPRIP